MMKRTAYFLFAIFLILPMNWGFGSRSFSVVSQQPECLLCHISSFDRDEFIMPWEQAYPECTAAHASGHICSICAMTNQGACPLCIREGTDDIPNNSMQELLAHQSRHQAQRLARFNRQGRSRQPATEWDQEEPSR